MLQLEPRLDPPEMTASQEALNELYETLDILRRSKRMVEEKLCDIGEEIEETLSQINLLEGIA